MALTVARPGKSQGLFGRIFLAESSCSQRRVLVLVVKTTMRGVFLLSGSGGLAHLTITLRFARLARSALGSSLAARARSIPSSLFEAYKRHVAVGFFALHQRQDFGCPFVLNRSKMR